MSNTPNGEPTAGASSEPDPIFAAIERHRAAFRIWRPAYDGLGALQDRWEFSEIPHYTDAPEWIEANTAYVAAVEEVAKALEILLSTLPTTIIGIADLLDYVGRVGRDECHPVAGTTNYEPVESFFIYRSASLSFLPMIAATLPRRATGEPDPIFAAIERHRAAVRSWLAAIDRRHALRQTIPEARRRWEFDERQDRCTVLYAVLFLHVDAPEWIEANTALIESCEALNRALEVVLSTPPTTIAGVADLLDYVSREEWEVVGADEWADELDGTIVENALRRGHNQGPAESPVRKAAANFLPMIAATLRSLTAESTSRGHAERGRGRGARV
jgi:hypothetical protein